jgi:Adenylate cyclase, family 3 (some proteins contain HAMP domain)
MWNTEPVENRVTSTETEVAILFADVVGSTRLYELLGDNRARELILVCIEVMREATERNRGTVVKTIGDEILAIFPTVDDALNAGGEMHEDIGARPELNVQGQHVAIRIGCHFGPVVLENKDIFGASVHTANRMTSQAKAGQIILSADSLRRCSPEWRAVSRRVDVTSLRGLTDEMELYEVLWRQEDATSMLPSIEMGTHLRRSARVRVRYRDQEVVLDDAKKELTMGRADENDIVVRGTLISRLHARIEAARDRFLLIDQSTNGSFVVSQEDGKEAFVRRDSVILQGKGLIGLGKLPDANAADVIRYQLED